MELSYAIVGKRKYVYQVATDTSFSSRSELKSKSANTEEIKDDR